MLCCAVGLQIGCNRTQSTPSPAAVGQTAGDEGDPARGAPTAEISPTFQDEAAAAGIQFRMHFLPNEQGANFKINLYDHGCGIAVADYDGDGWDDLYFVNQLGKNALYKNRGDGTFDDVTDQAGVGVGDRICVGVMFADYDNDGDQDLFVTSTRGGNLLFANQGDGTFRDVTDDAGVSHIGHSATAAFVDLDNDGWLDLVVTNTAGWTTSHFDEHTKAFGGVASVRDLIVAPKESNIVYRNQGDGKFVDITEASKLAGEGWGGDIAAFDYNDDGRIDLLITNMFGASQLYRNDGQCQFTSVTHEVLGKVSWGAIGAKAFDYDNDGRLDLFVSDMHSDMWLDSNVVAARPFIVNNEQAKYQYVSGPPGVGDRKTFMQREQMLADMARIRYDDVLFGNTLFKNQGGGRMEEVSQAAKLETWWPWGVTTGDFDCDGYEDVFIPSGMGFPYFYWPNHLMMNEGNGTFANRAVSLGVEPPREGELQPEKIAGYDASRSSRCAAVGDFDDDGRLEIVTNNFNDRPYYFRNHLPRKNYVAFKLTGTRSNRDAIGAVVKLVVGGQTMTRQVHSAGGYLSQSSKTLHFGLGGQQQIDRVEIRWPSGKLQQLEAPAMNQTHRLTEPAVKGGQ